MIRGCSLVRAPFPSDLDQARRDEYNKRALEVLKGDKPLLSIPIDRSEERELPIR